MVGTPFRWGDCLGRSSGVEQDSERLLEPPLTVALADESRKDLPLRASRFIAVLVHRDTS
jgi:hypothetical protein